MSCQEYDMEKIKSLLNLVNIKVNPYGSGRITEENLCKIIALHEEIIGLKGHGITSKNYSAKVDVYNNFRDTALYDYGIELNSAYPFRNPTEIHNQIEIILRMASLNDEQIKRFYNHAEIRKAKPKVTDIQSRLDFQLEFQELLDKSDADGSIAEEEVDIEYMSSEYYQEDVKCQEEFNYDLYLKSNKTKQRIAKIKKLQHINPLS